MNGIEKYAIKQLAESLREESKQAEAGAARWAAAINAPDAEGCERDESQHARGRATGLRTAANRLDELLAALNEN